MEITETFKKEIAPFFWSEYEGTFSVCLNRDERWQEVFETRAADGSGYDWEGLAKVFLEEKHPELMENIFFDSEMDMFCACSKDASALQDFALDFRKVCEDKPLMIRLFKYAELN